MALSSVAASSHCKLEEHRERVFRPRQYVDEAPEDQLEPV
jgi:hypothetical protein